MIDNGFGSPGEPILGPMTNIVEMDAILSYDDEGNPVEPEWPGADVIVGNPPFLGSRKMRPTLGDKYCESLQESTRVGLKVCQTWFAFGSSVRVP